MIVFKYLIREVLKVQMAVLLVLLTIFMSQHFVSVLASVSDGDFPAKLVLTLLGLNLPNLVVLVLPLSLFLGILIAHGRMYTDSEMVILHSVGISEWYIARVTLLLAIVNMIFTGFLSLYATSWAEETQNQVLENAQSEAGLATIAQGRFQKSPNGRAVLFVQKIGRDKTLSKVFVAQLSLTNSSSAQLHKGDSPLSNVVVAKRGKIIEDADGAQRIELNDGTQYQNSINKLDYQISDFVNYNMQIKEQEVNARRRKLKAISTDKLLTMKGPAAVAELHWRLAIPLAIFFMTLIAVPMARVNTRQGKFAKMFPAILLYLGYFGLMVTGRKALENGVIPIYLGMWWIHASALLLGIFLLAKERPIGAKITGLLKGIRVAN